MVIWHWTYGKEPFRQLPRKPAPTTWASLFDWGGGGGGVGGGGGWG